MINASRAGDGDFKADKVADDVEIGVPPAYSQQ